MPTDRERVVRSTRIELLKIQPNCTRCEVAKNLRISLGRQVAALELSLEDAIDEYTVSVGSCNGPISLDADGEASALFHELDTTEAQNEAPVIFADLKKPELTTVDSVAQTVRSSRAMGRASRRVICQFASSQTDS